MDRPTKDKAQERAATQYWCSQVKTFSGKSDLEIERALQMGNGISRLTGGTFKRWRTGERAMGADGLALFVRRARKLGLLPPARTGGIHTALDARVDWPLGKRPSEEREHHERCVKTLHRTRQAALAALQAYADAVEAANTVIVATPSVHDDDAADEVSSSDVRRLQAILSAHSFVDVSPWIALEGVVHR